MSGCEADYLVMLLFQDIVEGFIMLPVKDIDVI